MQVYDVLRNRSILFIILLVKDDKEEIKARHDWGRNLNIPLERSRAVVAAP